MATEATSDSSPDTDREFDPTADMLVHEFDDEQTLDEEEAMSNESAGNELDDLEKEGEMPLDELLAMYGYNGSGPPNPANEPLQESRSSSEEEILSNQDLTLDKDEIARDLHFLKDEENDNSTSVNDLMDSVNLKSNTARLLRSQDQAGSDEEDESADEDYQPQKDEDWKKTINVGSDFQAVVPPGLSKYGDAPAYENEDRLLWDPSKLETCNVEEFLKEVHKQLFSGAQGVHAIPTGIHIRDDEQALYLLLQCGHNVEEAIRRRNMQAVPPTDPMSLWSEEECRNFEAGLRLYGKDFYLIQQNKVRTRSVGELVQFYYLWKKTERHDVFANKNRLEKKKYALHPGVTDYMERFLDEHENPSLVRPERPSSPTNSLLYADPKRHHDHSVVNSEDANKPASPEEVAEALELVTKVVDPTTIFSPLKNNVIDITNALQQASATASVDLPGYVPSAPNATVSINPELKEGRSAENIVHIANVDTVPPRNTASPGRASSPSQNASTNNSSSLPRNTSSPKIDTSSMNGSDQPSAKRIRLSQSVTEEPLSVLCDSSDSAFSSKTANLSPHSPRSPKSVSSVRAKTHGSVVESSDSSSHLAGNVKLAINSSIVDKSISSHNLSPEAAVRPQESIAQ